jgi:branched-subunit amino acid ABC-type transport system permease component
MMQALLNGLVSGLLIALPAIALSLTYGILNFANFSIGAMVTTGAYLAYIANTSFGAPIILAAPMAAILLALRSSSSAASIATFVMQTTSRFWSHRWASLSYSKT